MKEVPSISIVTCSFNSDLTVFRNMLDSIAMQNYPKRRIEHLVMDGGSTNGTVALAKQYGCIVDSQKSLEHKAQMRAGLGIQRATHPILLILECDNILTS